VILENGYEVPEGMESMSCFHNCGFIILWAVGNSGGVGERMDEHYAFCPERPIPRNIFRTKGE
jgi:hypothetical protein